MSASFANNTRSSSSIVGRSCFPVTRSFSCAAPRTVRNTLPPGMSTGWPVRHRCDATLRSAIVLSGARNSEMSAVMSAYTFFSFAVDMYSEPESEPPPLLRMRTDTIVFTPPSCQSPP